MSVSLPLPDNALLQWLQTKSNNDYHELEVLEGMYRLFQEDQLDPLKQFKDDNNHHNCLIFANNEEGMATAQVLHHLAKFLKYVEVMTPYYDNKWSVTSHAPDSNWSMTSHALIQGQHITYALPTDLFTPVVDVQSNLFRGQNPMRDRT